MTELSWRQLPGLVGACLRAKWACAWRLSATAVKENIFGALVGIVTSIALEPIDGSGWLVFLLNAAIGCVAGASVVLLAHWFLAGPVLFAEQLERIEHLKRGFDFAGVLRTRKSHIERISVPSCLTQSDELDIAYSRLESEQRLVVEALYRDDSTWKWIPKGWARDIPSLYAWAGICAVMESRYPGEVIPQSELYTKWNDTEYILLPSRAHLVFTHSLNVLDLLIREIEFPDRSPRNREPEDRFRETVCGYLAADAKSQESIPVVLSNGDSASDDDTNA